MRVKTPTKEPAREKKLDIGPDVTIPDNKELIIKIIETVTGRPFSISELIDVYGIDMDENGNMQKTTLLHLIDRRTGAERTYVRIVIDPSQKVPYSESSPQALSTNFKAVYIHDHPKGSPTQTYGELYVATDLIQYESGLPDTQTEISLKKAQSRDPKNS